MTSLRSRFDSATWKGKQREQALSSFEDSDSDMEGWDIQRIWIENELSVGKRDGLGGTEGSGGEDGIVIPLDMVGGGFYEAYVYSLSSFLFVLVSITFPSLSSYVARFPYSDVVALKPCPHAVMCACSSRSRALIKRLMLVSVLSGLYEAMFNEPTSATRF